MNELISPGRLSSGNGWADQLRAYRQRTRGRSRGLERDASGICVFEGPLAVDTGSGAASSPGASLRETTLWTDTINRRTAAVSSGEAFDVGKGTATSDGHLEARGASSLWAAQEDVRRFTKSMSPSPISTNAMMTVNGQHGVGAVENEPAAGCQVVRAPTAEADPDTLVVMICILFRRYADELSRASSRLRPLETRR